MLINVFSLHRTGSTWWAHYIKNQYPDSKLYNEEILNKVVYFRREADKTLTTFSEYEEGLTWRCPNDNCTEVIHHSRKLTPEDNNRFDKWMKYFEVTNKIIICHTHLTPTPDEKYLTRLSEIGTKNYYVYRENVLEQIASFVISEYTGEYGAFTKDKSNISEKFTYPIISMESIEWMCYEIARADKLVNEK